jgi:imidazolonepropionase-like amidohydrolase
MTTLVYPESECREEREDPDFRFLTRVARNIWQVEANSLNGERGLEAARQRHKRWFSAKMTGALEEAGVPLLSGTDSFGVPCILPGRSLHRELELLEKSGLSPYQALQTATVNPAAFLGRSNEFGKIVRGQRADLLLLSRNPLEDSEVLREPKGVTIRGRWLPADQLRAMLSKIAEP